MTAIASTLDQQDAQDGESTHLSPAAGAATAPLQAAWSALRSVGRDIAHGLFIVTHNGLAMLGLVTLLLALTFGLRPDLRDATETKVASWLQEREDLRTQDEVPAELDAIDRVTATDPRDLPKEQARVADWLSKKYRVAPEPIAALVAEAYETGARVKLDPTLILAVMAIESSFNPFAQSHVGAQGLMQVMTQIHSDKYENYGGQFAAFDPVTNLRVGVKVLQDCIARAGSVAGGLKHYVGAANLPTDGGYAEKVIGEYGRLYQVAKGRALPPLPMPAPQVVVKDNTKDSTKPTVMPVSLPAAPAPVNKPQIKTVADGHETKPLQATNQDVVSATPHEVHVAKL